MMVDTMNVFGVDSFQRGFLWDFYKGVQILRFTVGAIAGILICFGRN